MGDNSNCFMRTLCITQFFVLIGHSYFGKNRTFLNWLDMQKDSLDIQVRATYTFHVQKQCEVNIVYLF